MPIVALPRTTTLLAQALDLRGKGLDRAAERRNRLDHLEESRQAAA